MPELAEVQQVADGLQRHLAGRRVACVDLRRPDWVKSGDLRVLEGRTVRSASRWGKRLVLECDGAVAVIGLGMTGHFGLGRGDEGDRHVLCVLELSDGAAVHYRDPRRFGSCHVFGSREQADAQLGARIGPDGAGPWRWHELAARAAGSRLSVKAALLDQAKIVSSLGNYLVDEILFDAQIAPTRQLNTLSRRDWVRLNRARMRVVLRALAHNGLTFDSYRDVDGQPGQMLDLLRVFGRAGRPCPRCATPIVRSVVAGRGTHTCPSCQPA